MQSNKSILITGIGGNVGQGVLRNIRSAFPDLTLVGTSIEQFTAGHHFCDRYVQVPYAYDAGFVDTIDEVCRNEEVDLIIPTTDYECFHLSAAKNRLPVVLASPASSVAVFLDKWKTWQVFSRENIPFAETMLPSDYDGRWPRTVVKPREGRGSRDIFRSPDSIDEFDDSYLIQPEMLGPEITSAFYITRQKKILGPITFHRELVQGMTERCEVTFDYESKMLAIMDAMLQVFELSGPVNVQAIVTTDGRVTPFEVNCRYSGTNSIRSQLGFEDVKYGVQEHLLLQEPDQPEIRTGCAVRILMDIVYPDQGLAQVGPGNSDSFLF